MLCYARMKKHLAWFLAAAFAAMVPLWAQTAGEIDRGAEKLESESDKKLNVVYQKLIRQIQADDKEHAAAIIAQLRESQRAWLKYCDAQTKFVALYNNIGSASARNVGVTSYHADLIKQRIKDLADVPNPY